MHEYEKIITQLWVMLSTPRDREHIYVSFAIKVDDNEEIDYSTVVVGYDSDDTGMISEAKKKVSEIIEEIIKQVSGDK